MNGEWDTLGLQVLSALFNGAGQGLLLTLVVALLFRGGRGVNAATRHAVGLAVLAAVLLLPAGHFLALCITPGPELAEGVEAPALPEPNDGERVREIASAPEPAPRFHGDATGSSLPDSLPAVVVETLRPSVSTPSRVEPAPRFVATAASELREPEEPPAPAAERSMPGGMAAGATLEPQGAEEPVNLTPAGVRPHYRAALPPRAGWILAGLWAGIVFVRLANLLRQCVQLGALRRSSQPAGGSVETLFQRLCGPVERRRGTRLALSDSNGIPSVAGFWRPTVLLPRCMVKEASEVELEKVLRHELAHVGRYDDWANLFQQVARAVLFFDPVVWWLSRRLAVDREIACDDHVLASLGSPRSYALLLADFAGRIQGRSSPAALAGWTLNSQLKERITMILDSKRNSTTHIARTRAWAAAGLAAAAMALGLGVAPRVVLAQSAAAPALPEAPQPPPPAVLAAPAPAPAVVVVGAPAPTAPRVALNVALAGDPTAAGSSEPRWKDALPAREGASLEERLDRLEQMMESLLDSRRPIPAQSIPRPPSAGNPGVPPTPESIEASVDCAVEQAMAATKQMEQEMKRVAQVMARHQVNGERQIALARQQVKGLDQHRQAIKAQRSAIDAQLREIEKQITRLEQQRERIEEQQSALDEKESALDEEEEARQNALEEAEEARAAASSDHDRDDDSADQPKR